MVDEAAPSTSTSACGRRRHQRTRDHRAQAVAYERPEGSEGLKRDVREPEPEEDNVVAAVRPPRANRSASTGRTRSSRTRSRATASISGPASAVVTIAA